MAKLTYVFLQLEVADDSGLVLGRMRARQSLYSDTSADEDNSFRNHIR